MTNDELKMQKEYDAQTDVNRSKYGRLLAALMEIFRRKPVYAPKRESLVQSYTDTSNTGGYAEPPTSQGYR